MGQKPHVKERDEAVQSCRVRKNSPTIKEGREQRLMARHKKLERRREIDRRRRRQQKRKKLRAKGLLPKEGKQGKSA
jgi:hypothetical protein